MSAVKELPTPTVDTPIYAELLQEKSSEGFRVTVRFVEPKRRWWWRFR